MTSPHDEIRHAWQEVLDVSDVADADDFFELGGQSLKAMDLVFRLKERFGVKVPVRLLFAHRTFGEFADAVERRLDDAATAGRP